MSNCFSRSSKPNKYHFCTSYFLVCCTWSLVEISKSPTHALCYHALVIFGTKQSRRSFLFLAAKTNQKLWFFCFVAFVVVVVVLIRHNKISTLLFPIFQYYYVYVFFNQQRSCFVFFFFKPVLYFLHKVFCSSSTPIRLVLSVCNPLRKTDCALSLLRVLIQILVFSLEE